MPSDPGSMTRIDIEKIARLARIFVTDAQTDELGLRLGNILKLVDQLQSVNTRGVVPMANPHDATQRLRADKVTEPDQHDAFLDIAPSTDAGLYLVPQVIE